MVGKVNIGLKRRTLAKKKIPIKKERFVRKASKKIKETRFVLLVKDDDDDEVDGSYLLSKLLLNRFCWCWGYTNFYFEKMFKQWEIKKHNPNDVTVDYTLEEFDIIEYGNELKFQSDSCLQLKEQVFAGHSKEYDEVYRNVFMDKVINDKKLGSWYDLIELKEEMIGELVKNRVPVVQ